MNSRYVFIRFTQNYLSDFVGAGLAGLLELKSDFRIGLSGDDSGTLDRLMEMIVRETGSGRDFSEHLLLNTGMTVKEIAAQTGYVDSCYLSRLFVRHYGVTPLQYRGGGRLKRGLLFLILAGAFYGLRLLLRERPAAAEGLVEVNDGQELVPD